MMAKFQITGPDGAAYEITAPDTASEKDVLAYVQSNLKATKQDTYDPTSGMSGTEKFLAGVGKGFADLGRGVGQMVGAVDRKDVDEANRRDKALMNTGAGFAGNITGNLAAFAPAALIPGANTLAGSALIGAGSGLLQPVGEHDSRIGNVALGASLGAAAKVGTDALGRIVRPVQTQLTPELEALAQKAKAASIPLDAADMTGSRPLKVMRSVMESMPLTAAKQAELNEAKRQAFNKAALSTIGETADKATPEVLNAARTRIGQSFNDLAARNDVQLGNDFLTAIAKIDASRNPFSAGKIGDVVDKALDLAASGKISGADYQKIRSTLGKQAKDAFNSGNSETGQALKSLRNALDDAAGNSIAPADQAAWKQARSQWQALKVLEKAAAPTSADAVAGNVSPAKLAQSMVSSDRQGFTYGTTNQDKLADLARIGQAFVKEQIPNSGTAERAFMQRFLETPGNALWQQGVGGISIPVQKMLNSKAGQAYLMRGPVDPRAKAIGDLLQRGTILGGATAPAYLSQ